MVVNEKLTKSARASHQAGIEQMDELFGRDESIMPFVGIQHGNARPIRLRPGVPPVRDAEHQAKHRKRKAQRAARRRNR